MSTAADQSPARRALAQLLANKMSVAGIIWLIIVALASAFAPALAPFDPEEMNFEAIAAPPSAQHWFGTDDLGRDLFSRVLFGGRISLMVGLYATAVAVTIGLVYGAVAGFCGGVVDRMMMRFVDAVYALPFIIFVILLGVIFGRSIELIFISIGAVEWLTMARIIRGQVLALRTMEYVDAARVMGMGNVRIITRHILPNVAGIMIIYATLMIPTVMLLEAFLSFLGLGVQAPAASWGTLIKEGSESMELYPWMIIFPSVIFSLTLFSLNFIGDGLRDAIDSRS